MSSRSLACYRAKGRHPHGTEFATTKTSHLVQTKFGKWVGTAQAAWVGIYSDVI